MSDAYDPWGLRSMYERVWGRHPLSACWPGLPLPGGEPVLGTITSSGTLSFDVPGVKLEDIKVEISGGVLRVTAERKGANKKTYHLNYNWPNEADPTKATAKLTNGVLTVTIPEYKKIVDQVEVPVTT